MERCSLLNGNTLNQDSDYSAPLLALTDGGVIEGLELSYLSGSNFEVSPGSCLIKCIKTNGDKILVHYQSTETVALSFSGLKKVWVEISQQNLDNPLLNPITGLGIGQIKYGDAYPTKNYVALASVNEDNEVTSDQLVIKNINTIINHAIAQIQIGATTFSATSTGATNSYNIEYAGAIPTSDEGSPLTIPQNILLYFKAHQTNTGSATISVNTTAGTLTATLKKMLNVNLNAGDIKQNQRVIMQRDGMNFQMQSQPGQVPVGSIQNVSVQGQVGEDVSVGQIGFVGKGVTDKMRREQLDASTIYNVGDGTNIKLRAMFLTSRDNILRRVTINLGKVGSPSDQIYCRLYATDGETLLASSSNYFNSSALTSSNEQKNFFFNDIVLQPQTKYFVAFERTGGNDVNNYYTLRACNTQLIYPMGFIEKYNGSAWERLQGYIWMILQLGYNHESGKWYPSQPEYDSTALMDGVFNQNKIKDEVCEVIQGGTANVFSLLTQNNNYFLNNLDSGNKNLSWNTTTHFGHSIGNQEKASMSFKLSSGMTVDKIFLAILRVGTPTDNFVVSIQTDDNGKPSGSLVHANATFSSSGTKLMTQAYRKLYQFNGSFSLNDSTLYWIVLERDGGLNTSNYYSVLIYNSDVYTRGNMMTYTNSIWVTQSWDMFFSFTNEYDGIRQSVYNENRNFGNSSTGMVFTCQAFHSYTPITIKSIMLAMWQISSPTDGVKIRIEKNFSQTPGTTGYSNVSWNSTEQTFGTVLIEKYAQSFTGSEYLETGLLNLYLKKSNVPSDEFMVRIETDYEGSPSGTLINTSAQRTLSPSLLTTGRDWYTLQFPGSLKMEKTTKYWVVLTRTGTVSATNYFSIGKHSSNPYTLGETKKFDGTSWIADTGDIMFRFGNTDFMIDAPSGELVDPNAEITIPVSKITTGFKNNSFDFPGSFTLDKNTKYWIVLGRTGTQVNAGYYQYAMNSSGPFMYGQYMECSSANFTISSIEHRSMYFNFGILHERPKGVINAQVPSFLNRCTYVGRSLTNTNIAIKNNRMTAEATKILKVEGWSAYSASCNTCNTEVWSSVFTVGNGNLKFEVGGSGSFSTTGKLYMADDEQTLMAGLGTLVQTLTTGNITFLANATKKYRIRLNGTTTCTTGCSAYHYAQTTFEPFPGSLIA
ncbi:hypothetical protein P148_SR1C00001G0878 [candidate division SR1 bacterium RAAC1_SR1_1]|nr:hypothetical protein P148_SR1C00001G0878 [candidate division SR1 bacterium RAAC1_SR1_1]